MCKYLAGVFGGWKSIGRAKGLICAPPRRRKFNFNISSALFLHSPSASGEKMAKERMEKRGKQCHFAVCSRQIKIQRKKSALGDGKYYERQAE